MFDIHRVAVGLIYVAKHEICDHALRDTLTVFRIPGCPAIRIHVTPSQVMHVHALVLSKYNH